MERGGKRKEEEEEEERVGEEEPESQPSLPAHVEKKRQIALQQFPKKKEPK